MLKGLVPTGGRGTRMRPVTYSINKHFIPVANKLLIEYPIEALVASGITEIGITYNPGGLEQATEVLGDGSRYGARFEYILQEKAAGLANIVECAREWVGSDDLVFHLGDNIFCDGIKEIVEEFLGGKWDGLLPMLEHPENSRMGVPYFDEAGNLIKYLEKPENPPHKMAVPGLYLMKNAGFGCFDGADRIKPSARGEYEIPDLFTWMLTHGYKVGVAEYKGKWLDPGKFDDWLTSNQYLLDRYTKEQIDGVVDEPSSIEGRVEIEEGSQIVNSKIRGPVRIGKGVVITDSFVGPFTSIYDESELSGVRVEGSVLMKGVKLSKLSKTIDQSIIGAGAQVSDDGGKSVSLFLGEGSKVVW